MLGVHECSLSSRAFVARSADKEGCCHRNAPRPASTWRFCGGSSLGRSCSEAAEWGLFPMTRKRRFVPSSEGCRCCEHTVAAATELAQQMSPGVRASCEQGWELEDRKSCLELLLQGWVSPW